MDFFIPVDAVLVISNYADTLTRRILASLCRESKDRIVASGRNLAKTQDIAYKYMAMTLASVKLDGARHKPSTDFEKWFELTYTEAPRVRAASKLGVSLRSLSYTMALNEKLILQCGEIASRRGHASVLIGLCIMFNRTVTQYSVMLSRGHDECARACANAGLYPRMADAIVMCGNKPKYAHLFPADFWTTTYMTRAAKLEAITRDDALSAGDFSDEPQMDMLYAYRYGAVSCLSVMLIRRNVSRYMPSMDQLWAAKQYARPNVMACITRLYANALAGQGLLNIIYEANRDLYHACVQAALPVLSQNDGRTLGEIVKIYKKYKDMSLLEPLRGNIRGLIVEYESCDKVMDFFFAEGAIMYVYGRAGSCWQNRREATWGSAIDASRRCGRCTRSLIAKLVEAKDARPGGNTRVGIIKRAYAKDNLDLLLAITGGAKRYPHAVAATHLVAGGAIDSWRKANGLK